ncbi:MAG: NHLP family bacteriocin export ABC transporter peptidase/permease/ATPase subunit [Thermoleophilaceae bacterium]|nr:NHLP family bacteriocin export ABC transporter peptidase/permease/ATPase subunit [Thermoleophilaceae bacterium]
MATTKLDVPHVQSRRVHTPTVLQLEAVECGAAALAMVLAYYGRYVSLEELRAVCGVSRDGAKASNVVKAARSYGLEAKGVRTELSRLADLRVPAIAFWNFNHFVVVEGIGAKGVDLNDPASGPRRVSWEEFDASFTGVALVFEPGPEFAKGGERPSVVRGLATRLRGGAAGLVLCILAGFALTVPGLAAAAFLKIFVDEILVADASSWLLPVAGGLALTGLVAGALTWLQQATLLRLSTKLSLSMSTRFLSHALRLPMTFFTQRYAGHVVTRLNLNDLIAELLSSQLATSLLSLVTVVFYLGLMAHFDLLLTAITVVFAVANIAALHAVSRRRVDVNRRLVADTAKLQGIAIAGLQNIETVKATGAEPDFFARWAGQQAKVVNARQELGVPTQILAAVPALLAALTTAAILGFGGWRVIEGDLSLGTLVAFQALAAAFNAPIANLVALGSSLQEMAGNLANVDDVLRYPPEPDKPRRRAALPARLSGALELRDVTFGYSALAPPVIEGFSLRMRPGQRVALVGPSGSGKTTVSRLVCGLYRPLSGEILLDGVPRDEIPREILAASLALVDQDIVLFEATVRDTLALWDGTLPDASIVAAARDAAIHGDVVRRPGGYDRIVEEGGRDWSGGQRQRLEIARALAGDPALLVLDEATSALDPLVERQIDERLRARGCTCLIVAHRLSTIRDCDEIVVLDHGKVVQRGTHDELKAQAGLYATLIDDG